MKRLFASNRVAQLITVVVLAVFTAVVSMGQTAPGKKSYTFQGKVEAIDVNAKSLKINGEKVEGWMDAMVMAYKVDDVAILKTVKVGDQIMATVYDGDMVLHKVMVMPSKMAMPKGTGSAKPTK
jgi:Cu/Ag efflux protein CusF